MSETEKNVIEEVVEAVGEVVSDIVRGIESILLPSEKANDKQTSDVEIPRKSYTQPESALQTENLADLNEETRVGYAPSLLPQAEEPETETGIEPDDKDQIEAAIAKARETHLEAEADAKDPLVAETLPVLPRANAAKLYLQSPNRVFFYWSLTANPFETLRKAFGRRADNYQLVTRITNLNTKAESFSPAEIQGNWWYNVRSNATYRVDLGFYAANRPFIRILSSNKVQTPRVAPSPRVDTEADWIVSTKQFVRVLTASGYSHDVLNVAFGADDETGEISEETATLIVANRFATLVKDELNLAELRWLLISLATGVQLQDLRAVISNELAAWLDRVLQSNPTALETENVRAVLESIFGAEFVEMFGESEEIVWERLSPVAIGGSAIHFPEILFPKLRLPDSLSASNPLGEESLPEDLRFSSQEFLN